MTIKACPECGGKELNFSATEIHCVTCGLVVEETMLDQGFITESTKSSATLPFLATAGTKGKDGKIFKESWTLSTKEKNLRLGLNKIDVLSGKLNLPDFAIKDAKLIFKKAMNKDLAVGRDRLSINFASVYLACMVHGIPKTPLEIVMHGSVSKKALMKAYKLIKSSLGIVVPLIDPIDLVPRFASKLDLKPETVTTAIELVEKIKEQKLLCGKRPETIVATALYVASKITGEKVTQRNVSNAVGVIEVTIRKYAKKLILLDSTP